MNNFISTLLIGTGATAVMDLWGLVRKPLFGIAHPDYGMVGRWFGHMASGRFRHEAIAASPAVANERLIGWTTHYLVGIIFAFVLVAAWGPGWIQHPTIVPALTVGLGSLAAPFLLMQPGMGAGIAASRTPRPAAARLQSFITHAIFGAGLYAAGWATLITSSH